MNVVMCSVFSEEVKNLNRIVAAQTHSAASKSDISMLHMISDTMRFSISAINIKSDLP